MFKTERLEEKKQLRKLIIALVIIFLVSVFIIPEQYVYGSENYGTVNFRSGVDDSIIKTEVVMFGYAATPPLSEDVPVPDGYQFYSWDNDGYMHVSEYELDVRPLMIPVSGDQELSSTENDENINRYKVTFFIDDNLSSVQLIEEGDKVSRPVDPVKDGYTFIAWRSWGYGAFDFNTIIDSDLELSAQFTRDEVPLHQNYWKAGPGGSIRDFVCPVEECKSTLHSSVDFYFHPLPTNEPRQLALIVVNCGRCGTVSEWRNTSNNGASLASPGAAPSATNNVGMGGAELFRAVNSITFLPGANGFLSHGGPGADVTRNSIWDPSWEPDVWGQPGYTFVGWKDQYGVHYDKNDTDFPSPVYQNYVFTAQYTDKKPFRIVFDINAADATGSKPSMSSVFYEEDITLNLNSFVRAGWEFAGWNTEADGSGIYITDGETFLYSQKSNMILFAQWVPYDYTVSYDANGGVGAPVDSNTYNMGDEVTVLGGVPTKDGHIFVGWLLGEDIYESGGTFDMPADNVTLVAQWIKRNDLEYVIMYYKDTVEGGNLLGTSEVIGPVAYLEEITLAEGDEAGQLDYLRPAGYLSGIQQGAVPFIAGDSENIIKVLYTVDYTAEIIISTEGGEQVYNGLALTKGGYSVTGMPAGHALTATLDGSQTDVGSSDNTIAGYVIIRDSDGEDVTNLFVNVEEDPGTLTVTPAELTIIVNDISLHQGSLIPTQFGVTIIGLVNYEDYTVLQGLGEYLTGYTPNALAGERFPVKLSGWYAANYEITYIHGYIDVLAVYSAPGDTNGSVDTIGDGVTSGDGGANGVEVPQSADTLVNGEETSLDSIVTKIEDLPAPHDPAHIWSLMNLMLTITTVLIAVALIATYYIRMRMQESEGKKVEKYLLPSLAGAVAAAILFLITQDMSMHLALTDQWTLWHIFIISTSVILCFLVRKTYVEEEYQD